MDRGTNTGAESPRGSGTSPLALAGVLLAVIAAVFAFLLALKSDTVQRLSVGQAPGVYTPAVLTARPGRPVQVTFTRGGGCMTRVTFPELGISRDIPNGGTVNLPSMPKGRYTFTCDKELAHGEIRVK